MKFLLEAKSFSRALCILLVAIFFCSLGCATARPQQEGTSVEVKKTEDTAALCFQNETSASGPREEGKSVSGVQEGILSASTQEEEGNKDGRSEARRHFDEQVRNCNDFLFDTFFNILFGVIFGTLSTADEVKVYDVRDPYRQ